MSNALQPSAREAFATGLIDWVGDTIKVVLLDSGYSYSAAHEDLADVGAGTRIATSAGLANKTATDGILDADDYTFATLAAGDTITQLWVFQDTGVEATSLLIAFFDTRSDSNPISVATNGGDVEVQWANTTNRIARI